VKSAGTVSGHLARLLLLACTVLGVAALHTIGHAGVTGPGRHHPASASVAAAVVPGEAGGCDGDGCPHHAAGPGEAADTSRWWDACLAILSVLAGAALVLRLSGRVRAGAARAAVPFRWRPPPRPARVRPTGLLLVTAAVLRT